MSREDVRARFARNAANYVTSAFHADSALLDEVVALAVPQPTDVVLDVATGTGNTAFALAPHVARVVGLDLTPEMLDQARRLAAERGVANVEWVVGDAQQLPFPDASFDLYTVPAARLAELAVPIETAGGRARAALRPERRAGKLWHAYWHAEIRAVKP